MKVNQHLLMYSDCVFSDAKRKRKYKYRMRRINQKWDELLSKSLSKALATDKHASINHY